MRVAIITLGCDKNTVDSEYLAGLLEEAGHPVFPFDKERPFDVLVINTCGFIDIAKEESINVILSWAEEKKRRQRAGLPSFRLLVVGCLAERYARELGDSIQEIDALVGVGRWKEVVKFIESPPGMSKTKLSTSLPRQTPRIKILRPMPRRKLDDLPYAFLKIADGCSHRCSFCAIPLIKGSYRSVPRKILLTEAQELIKSGIREINLVAQDINRYGKDLYKRYDLVRLVRDIAAIPGKFWIRLLYFYPQSLPQRMVHLIKEEPKLCPYIDIPLQHLSPDILRRMGRPAKPGRILHILGEWREQIPDLTIRTTFIVGFPGETRGDFSQLLAGVREFGFDRLGAFLYSSEEGTRAGGWRPVPTRTARRRLERLMEIQENISFRKNQAKVERISEVLVEQGFPDQGLYIARSRADAPEVDGAVIIHSDRLLNPGEFVRVRITEAQTYDLIGHPVGP